MTTTWQDIGTCPTYNPDEDAPLVLLWVDNGGHRGQGCCAFGRCYRSADGSVRAVPLGFHGFNSTHWMPLPEPPNRPSPPSKEGE